MPSILPQLLVNGIIAGAIYALVASGFSLIYSVARVLHFAHGAVLATGGYLFFLTTVWLGIHPILAIIATIILTGALGGLMQICVYGPLRKRKSGNAGLLIASMALMILLNSILLIVFGADVKTLPLAAMNRVFDIAGTRITSIQFAIIGTAAVLLLGLWYLMKRTRLGTAMRAVADNPEVARTVGISPEKINVWTLSIGSAIAGAAGILIGLEQNLYPNMGTSLAVKGFTSAVIGGLSSVPGSVLGGLLLGVVENLGIWFLPSGYKDAIAFVLLFIFLLARPQGILGTKGRVA